MEEKRAVLAHYLQIQQKLVQGRRVKKSVRSELPVAANLDTSEPPIKSDRSWLIIPKIKEKWWGLASIPNRTIRELHRCWPLRTRTPKSSSCECGSPGFNDVDEEILSHGCCRNHYWGAAGLAEMADGNERPREKEMREKEGKCCEVFQFGKSCMNSGTLGKCLPIFK
ncbi:Hypothetical predicted protein [Olea europaea subsp. europaea]|uniref:Uncharacterized protein n=1 Tax=Olea europaea subsp. europaea TaxID=158383 RepID=A0A8S0Q6E9_OLEEU|nr:Hypothetical predicted protein [Olea europaea subsp. europaea]